jgi:2-polyprenyl-6-hydroxyphenyl methylase/3-demethylubiquinone-9 3-methyltransferase
MTHNVDSRETDKFGRLAAEWWDPKGPMHSLHAINPLRVGYIAGLVDLRGKALLDVGCGGGLLAESLARAGARVTGIDLAPDLVELARRHAQTQGLPVEYRLSSVEEMAVHQPGSFDVVTCMEVLEHIPEPARAVGACARALRSGGHAFFATLDRSLWSLLFAIVVGERIIGLLPAGSHRYGMLIRPRELLAWAAGAGLQFEGRAGVIYDPLTGKFHVAPRYDMSYMVHFTRP